MPTENRSSNTEMVSELLPCPFCNAAMHVESNRDWHRAIGDHADECVFTDSETMMVPATDAQRSLMVADWNRRAQPAPQPHPEPIAWMVGTAFWWTKEEAERDAEATGLPIVGLGPMPDAGEAARLRIELGHMRDERDDLSAKLDRFYSRTHGIKNLAAIEELSAKLADRDALLTDISKRHWSGVDFDLPADLVDRIKALSASAEPNAPGVLPRAHDVNMFQRTAEPGTKS
ncbi:hypothetical protein ABE561_12375 [Pseudomonas asiatica]|uniref:hypothetical protein n=1 Tax=Pseudomonas asiatica TaxID=2219225 RepID=UPI003209239B